MASPTEWEKKHVEAIDTLLKNCQIRNAEFNFMHLLLNENPNAQIVDADKSEWLRFRSFTIDLYSVLDYICYLLFCHFQNNGQPDFSERSRNVKFPTSQNLKRSNFSEQEDAARQKRENWKQNQMEIIFGYGPFLEEEVYKFLDFFSTFILEVQNIQDVDAAGKVIKRNSEGESNAAVFSLLHFFRNYSAHRDFVRCRAEQGVLYINTTINHPCCGQRVFLPQNQAPPWGNDCEDAAHWQSIQIAKGFWVEFPVVKPLMIVAARLLHFVKQFREDVVRRLTGIEYPHDVRWTFEGLTVNDQFIPLKKYLPILNRHVL